MEVEQFKYSRLYGHHRVRDRKWSFPDRSRWVQPSPINASSSRVKRCALPSGKGATVNLSARGSRRHGEEGFERWVVTLVRALELSRFGPTFASGTPLCCAAPFPSTCACAYVHDHLCERGTYRRRPQMDTISNYLPGSDNTHFSINSPALFFHPILRTFCRESFVLSIESGILGANCIFNFTECASYGATKFLTINKENWKNRSYTILKQIKYIDCF